MPGFFDDPLVKATGLNIGGGILGGLGGFFGGGTDRRRAQKREDFSDLSRERLSSLFDLIMGQRGQDVFNPGQLVEQVQRDINPQLERTASQIIRNQGSLGGVGGKQLLRTQSGLLGNRLIDLQQRNIGLKQQRDLSGQQSLLSLFGRFA